MNLDAYLRAAAIAAAAALVVAPKWGAIATAAVRLAQAVYDAAKSRSKTLRKATAAGLVIAAGWGVVPMPKLPTVTPRVEVETPGDEMQQTVAGIAAAMRGMSGVDRMLWADTWNKAAIVVAAPDGPEPLFTNTTSLRMFTALALDIAWRRIGGHEPGSNEPLRKAVEAAYGEAVGGDGVAVNRAVRDRYAAFAKAVAWAGMNGG